MTPADKIAALDVRMRFAREVLRAEEAIDLGRAALLVAAEEDTRCDIARSLAALDELGAEARARVERGEGSRVEALNRYLFDELGFVGNQSDYYDPRNSM
ncbi:MAG TPA: transglutaminase family protein, partial [Pyrinomonadaceae bacterium]